MNFRNKLLQKVSIIRLEYFLKALKVLYPKSASISDPDTFSDKVKLLEKLAMKQQVKKMKSSVSNMSGVSGKLSSLRSLAQSTGLDEDDIDNSASG